MGGAGRSATAVALVVATWVGAAVGSLVATAAVSGTATVAVGSGSLGGTGLVWIGSLQPAPIMAVITSGAASLFVREDFLGAVGMASKLSRFSRIYQHGALGVAHARTSIRFGPMPQKLRIDIWSDIACPWCYVGKRRIESALERFAHRDAVEIVWRAFELDPSAPPERDRTGSYAQRLADKYGTPLPEAVGMIERMTATARGDGLDFRFDRVRSGNTFDAHRLIHLAGERGVQDAVKERFLRGYMTEGEPIGDREALVRMATEAGLDAEQARATLENGAFADEVRADEQEARDLGIRGVPFFVLDGRYAISGAQPADLLLGALGQAWKEIEQKPVTFSEGAACGPDGCT